jgi:hypothetical protein
MKTLKTIITLTALLFFIFSQAQTPMKFIHPGGVVGQTELDFVKAKIAAKQQPWYKAFLAVKALAKPGTNAMEYIDSHDDNGDAAQSKDDAIKTYANALSWYFTDQQIYAEQAVALLNSWTILKGFNNGTDQDKLHAGWIGALFGPAAEIMRDYPGWKPEDQLKVKEMFKRAYYPQLMTASTWNGNVDLTQIDALLNIAVFNEDEVAFNLGISRLKKRNPAYFYLSTDAASSRNYGGSSFPGSWSSPTLLLDGLTQETCRDNDHHAPYGMGSAIHAAEVAWNQGIDVYTENTKRYTATMELIATQILTGEMQGTCANNKTSIEYLATWEIGYNHYHNRKGIAMPHTEKLIKDKIRTQGVSYLNIFYETLTHADIVYQTTSARNPVQSPAIWVFPNPSDDGLFQINKEVNWEVYNISGCKLKCGFGNTIKLPNLTCGIYLLKTENKVMKIAIN